VLRLHKILNSIASAYRVVAYDYMDDYDDYDGGEGEECENDSDCPAGESCKDGSCVCANIDSEESACCVLEVDDNDNSAWICHSKTKSACQDMGGVWHFNSLKCSAFGCADEICEYLNLPGEGACCIDKSCQTLSYEDCIAQEGDYMGDDIPCETSTCEEEEVCSGSQEELDHIDELIDRLFLGTAAEPDTCIEFAGFITWIKNRHSVMGLPAMHSPPSANKWCRTVRLFDITKSFPYRTCVSSVDIIYPANPPTNITNPQYLKDLKRYTKMHNTKMAEMLSKIRAYERNGYRLVNSFVVDGVTQPCAGQGGQALEFKLTKRGWLKHMKYGRFGCSILTYWLIYANVMTRLDII